MNHGYTVVQTAELVAALRWVTGQLFEIIGAWAHETAQAVSAAANRSADDNTATATNRSADDDTASPANRNSSSTASAEAAVWMATLSRRIGCHREMLDGLQPDSDLLAQYRLPVPPDPSVDAAFAEMAATDCQWTERLAVMLRVPLPQLLAAYDEIARTGAQHCDGALIRTARALHHDLQPHFKKGEQLLAALLVSPNRHTESESATLVDHAAERTSVTLADHDAERASATLSNRVSGKLKAVGGIVPRRLLCPSDNPPTRPSSGR